MIATHIVSDVEAIANEIFLMGAGKVIEHASPQKLIRQVSPYVYTTTVQSVDEITQLEKSFTISNIYNSMHGIQVKLIQKSPQDLEFHTSGYEPAAANLEDVYLYHF